MSLIGLGLTAAILPMQIGSASQDASASDCAVVGTAQELVEALSAPNISEISLGNNIEDLGVLNIPVGVDIDGNGWRLDFKSGQDGIILDGSNSVKNITINVDSSKNSVSVNPDSTKLGNIVLDGVSTSGIIDITSENAASASVNANDVKVIRADPGALGLQGTPTAWGVNIYKGAFNIYNRSRDDSSKWDVSAKNISVGTSTEPISGSGVFVSGGDYVSSNVVPAVGDPVEKGGQVAVRTLTTGAVYTHGPIVAGVATQITGGVFIGAGATAESVVNNDIVSTAGVNDMVLDNWGVVKNWTANGKVTSTGQSGIGFVNFGDITELNVNGDIETFGQGARGMNQYANMLTTGNFNKITTHGAGAVGIQLSVPFGIVNIRKGIETFGGIGSSLVKGVLTQLPADGLSLDQQASGTVNVQGGINVASPDVKAVSVNPDTLAVSINIDGTPYLP